MKEQVRCSFCGAVLTEESVHEFEGQVMCEDCFYEQTTECECCHERIWQDNAEIAALQLVDEICRLAITFDDKTVEKLSWSDFVSSISKNSKPELIEYLKSKRLYVNDDVVETEEV